MGKPTGKWYLGILIFLGITIFIVYLNSSATSQSQPDINKKLENKTVLYIDVKRYNETTLYFNIRSPDYEGNLRIGNTLSYSKDFVKVVSPVKSNRSGKEVYFDGNLSYFIKFPIYWNTYRPYAVLQEDFGVSESVFLFFRPKKNINYVLNFSNLDLSVFNSLKGQSKVYRFNKKELVGSYFVFGDYNDCSKEYGDLKLKILFNEERNPKLCNKTFRIFSYYNKKFGKPSRTQDSYTISYLPATSFGGRSSGFFVQEPNLRFVSHEIFHQWQPGRYNCSNKLIYREGLTSFMALYSQLQTGLMNQSEFERSFSSRYGRLKNPPEWSNLSRLKEFYFSDGDELYKIRKESGVYGLLVYYKGSLVWNGMYENGINVTEVFNDYLKTKNCENISNLSTKYEKKLYEELYLKS